MISVKGFEQAEQAILQLSQELELDRLPNEFEIEIERGEGLSVSCKGNRAVLSCKEKIHVFRAMGLLMEQLKEGVTEFEIQEEVQFQNSGLMFDVSRNAVLNMETFKKMLRYMAVMGLNSAWVYMEDIYEVKEYPYFGYMRGRYSFEELQELDRYAAQFGIEMVPCIQTLGHLESALRWEYAEDIKDTNGVLLVGEEKTYQLIEALIKAVTAPFATKRVHLGMDEAWYLGCGAYLRKNGARNTFDIMTEHLNRVMQITDALGLQAMIWSDMFFRIGSKTHEYYDRNSVFPADLKEQIPVNLGLVYWDYYHTTTEEYEIFLKKHQELSDDIIFAGGIWTWGGMAPKHQLTTDTTNCGLTICKKYGVKEAIATMWGDNGAEVNIMTALYGMQQYAEHTYYANPTDEQISKRFRFCVKEDPTPYIALSALDELDVENMQQAAIPSKNIMWQDILCGLYDDELSRLPLEGHYKKLEEIFLAAKENSTDCKLVYDYYAKFCAVLEQKWDMGIRMKKAYDAKDTETLKALAEKELPELQVLVETMRTAARTLWLSTNKPFGFDVLDIRFGGVKNRIDTTIYRVKEYLSGKALQLEELEQERLPFSKYSVSGHNWYKDIATVSPVI